MINLHLRFYEELNDFLPVEKQKINFDFLVSPNTSIKDVVESLGVPHTEIDLILVNGTSVDFSYRVRDDDYISVYPVFEAFDISEIIHLRPNPLRNTKFILDVHLGKLARYLRLFGFDTAYDNYYTDETIALRSQHEKRIVLTRDVGLLKNKNISHGYWMRHIYLEQQVQEVFKRFDLYQQCRPFTRCMECNGILESIDKNEFAEHIPPLAFEFGQHYVQCQQCRKIYWEGTHYQKLKHWINSFLSKSIK